MSLTRIASGHAASSGVISIAGLGAATGDLLIVQISADGGGGTTSITPPSPFTTPAATTSTSFGLGGSPPGTATSWLYGVVLPSGFATSYTWTVSPTSTSGLEMLFEIWRPSTPGNISIDFATGSNSGPSGTVSLTNPGGTTTQANAVLIWFSMGQNPDVNQGPAGWSNQQYLFSAVWTFGVDALSDTTQATAGSTGTITANSTGSTNNWVAFVVAVKEAAAGGGGLLEYLAEEPSKKASIIRARTHDILPLDARVPPAVLASGAWEDNPAKSVRPRKIGANDHIPLDAALPPPALSSIGWNVAEPAQGPITIIVAVEDDSTNGGQIIPVDTWLDWGAAGLSWKPTPAKANDVYVLDSVTTTPSLKTWQEWTGGTKPLPLRRSPSLDSSPLDALQAASLAEYEDWTPWARPTPPRFPQTSDAPPLDVTTPPPLTHWLEWGLGAVPRPIPRPNPLDAHVLDGRFVPSAPTSWLDWGVAAANPRTPPARPSDWTPLDRVTTVAAAAFLDWTGAARSWVPSRPSTQDPSPFAPLGFAPSSDFIDWAGVGRIMSPAKPVALDVLPLDRWAPAITYWLAESNSPRALAPTPTKNDAPFLGAFHPPPPPDIWIDWAEKSKLTSPPRAFSQDYFAYNRIIRIPAPLSIQLIFSPVLTISMVIGYNGDMPTNGFLPGQAIRFAAAITSQVNGVQTFTDATGTLALIVVDPTGASTTYPSPTRDALGNYHQDVLVPASAQPGTWLAIWEATGPNVDDNAATKSTFLVGNLGF